jgi:multiple sugar transport system substrate-binding protein
MMLVLRCLLAGGLLLASAAMAGAETTIELWSFIDPAGDSVRSQALKAVIDAFERENPGVKVKTSIINWDQLGAALLRASQARRTPDLSMLHSGFIQRQVAAKALRPLDEYLVQMPAAERDDLIILPTGKDKAGKTYGVPYELRVSGFIYRADLLRKYGIDVPKTLPQLVSAAKRIQEGEGEGFIGMSIAFNPARSDRAARWFVPTLVGMGGKVLNADGTAAFHTPEAVRLVSWIKDTIEQDKIMPLNVALSDPERDQQLAEAGRVAFDLEATHWLAAMRQKLPKNGAELSWMPSPAMDPGKPTPADTQGWNLVIPAAAAHPQEAWRLIERWIAADMQLMQAQTAGYLPMRKSLQQSAALQKPEMAFIPKALEHASKDVLAFEWPENTDALNIELGRAIEAAISGAKPPAVALAEAEKNYNNIIGK